MKALISKVEPRNDGWRVTQVEPNKNVFSVAEDLFWVDCPEECVADAWYYNTETGVCEPLPVDEALELSTSTPTIEELQAQLQALQQQIASLGA